SRSSWLGFAGGSGTSLSGDGSISGLDGFCSDIAFLALGLGFKCRERNGGLLVNGLSLSVFGLLGRGNACVDRGGLEGLPSQQGALHPGRVLGDTAKGDTVADEVLIAL